MDAVLVEEPIGPAIPIAPPMETPINRHLNGVEAPVTFGSRIELASSKTRMRARVSVWNIAPADTMKRKKKKKQQQQHIT